MDINLEKTNLLKFIQKGTPTLKVDNKIVDDDKEFRLFIKQNADKIDKNYVSSYDENILFYIYDLELAKLLITNENIKFKNKIGQNALLINLIPTPVLEFYISNGMDITASYKESGGNKEIDYFESLLYPLPFKPNILCEQIILGVDKFTKIPPTVVKPLLSLLKDKEFEKGKYVLDKLIYKNFDFAEAIEFFVNFYEDKIRSYKKFKIQEKIEILNKLNDLFSNIYLDIFKRDDLVANKFKKDFILKYLPDELIAEFQKNILEETLSKKNEEKSYNVVKKARL